MFGEDQGSETHTAFSSRSVTALLRADSGYDVVADVIQEGWRKPTHRESWILMRYKIPTQLCWIREVLLMTNGNTRAIARILVPGEELQRVRWVQRLGANPLGAILFDSYNPVRDSVIRENGWFVHLGRRFSLRAQDRALAVGFKSHESYWLRSSVLSINNVNSHFVVTECFLQ